MQKNICRYMSCLVMGMAIVSSGCMSTYKYAANEREAEDRSVELAKLSRKVNGDYDKLTPEEQARADKLTNGGGRQVIRNLCPQQMNMPR